MRGLLLSLVLLAAAPAVAADRAEAIFAGGCFWCTEADFEKLDGVIEATSGYIGGELADPSYEQVSAGGTGHAEAVRIRYDPAKISYPALVGHFWRSIDPSVSNRQFCDVGEQYRSAIFYRDEAQRRIAQASLDELRAGGRFETVYTRIEAAGTFYEAEEYHQDYYEKNPLRYRFYRWNCGRDQRLAEIWGE